VLVDPGRAGLPAHRLVDEERKRICPMLTMPRTQSTHLPLGVALSREDRTHGRAAVAATGFPLGRGGRDADVRVRHLQQHPHPEN
jgi:hypothetical protein